MSTSNGLALVPGDLIPVKEAGILIGVNAATVRHWVRDGAVRGWRKGRVHIYVSRAEVLALAAVPIVPRGKARAAAAEVLADLEAGIAKAKRKRG